MGNKRIIVQWLALLLLPVACKKNRHEDPVDFKYEYAPVQVGHYCIYDVTSIEHDDAVGKHDTTHYLLKEKIESTFVDAEGRPSLRLERSKKTGTGPWVITDIWYSTRTTTQYEKVEEDERFVRLAFPVSTDTKWNGNVYNQEGEWDYIYKDVGVTRTISGLHFAETAQVLQRDEYNFVQRQLCTEVYARNIGLVQKYFKDISITGFDTTLALKGEELYMTITGYGVE
jgi:hypothetical protein